MPEQSVTAHLPERLIQQFVFLINIPLYNSVIFPFSASVDMNDSSLFCSTPCSFPFSHLCLCLSLSFSICSAALHTTEDDAGLHTCLCKSSPIAEIEKDRGGAVLVDVSSDIKRMGEGKCMYVITQGSCCRQEGWGWWRLLRRTRRTRRAACQTKQWLPPYIALQSMTKQIISAVQHSTGNGGEAHWAIMRATQIKCQ